MQPRDLDEPAPSGRLSTSGSVASQSGAVPDLAFLLDPWTIEQAFTEAFFCDEAAFFAIMNWAYRFHSTGVPIVPITIT